MKDEHVPKNFLDLFLSVFSKVEWNQRREVREPMCMEICEKIVCHSVLSIN